MRVDELEGKRIAIWGLGREGRAAIRFVRKRHPGIELLLLDDTPTACVPEDSGEKIECAFGADAVSRAVERMDVIIKSPGVSLYHPSVRTALRKGVSITSLLNLWFSEPRQARAICVTGTKGKSTTASLITHALERIGKSAVLVGNIGLPITDANTTGVEYVVIEVSSYQAADFEGTSDFSVLTSLYPEHIDWHLSVSRYYADKLNLLRQSRQQIINFDSVDVMNETANAGRGPIIYFNKKDEIHGEGTVLFDGRIGIGPVENVFLARAHNLSNVCAALTVIKCLGGDVTAALRSFIDFEGLPHRQQELGVRDGILFVNDSISTTPESAIAAVRAYEGRDITIIVGGFDRGIDYGKLVDEFLSGAVSAAICLGDSGARIYAETRDAITATPDEVCRMHRAASMEEAVFLARKLTKPGGVVLLSPAAPSYGPYKNFVDRGRDFAAKAGFPVD